MVTGSVKQRRDVSSWVMKPCPHFSDTGIFPRCFSQFLQSLEPSGGFSTRCIIGMPKERGSFSGLT